MVLVVPSISLLFPCSLGAKDSNNSPRLRSWSGLPTGMMGANGAISLQNSPVDADHHVRVPCAESGANVLVGRPHVSKRDALHLGQLAQPVCSRHFAGDGAGILAFHPEVGPHLFCRNDGAAGDRVEADWRPQLGVVRRFRVRGCAPAPQHHADKAVVALGGDLVSGGCEYFDCGTPRNFLGRRAPCQGNLGLRCHHVLAERRILAILGHEVSA